MIEIKKSIDTEKHLWCREAELIRVVGGKAALASVSGEDQTDYYRVVSTLILNGRPILQGDYPICSTCSALLARGYGIEKTDCKELQAVRDKINSDFVDLETSIRNIEPILNLLEDGYYVVADAEVYPTDGDDRFFANVPDELSSVSASCSGFFNHEFLDVVDGFPAFLYPTQSNSALDPERAEYYLPKIRKENAPRAIAYYNSGFVCALLDGHHKAYAAAKLGCMLKTLVIIPGSAVYTNYRDRNNPVSYACFADIEIPLSQLDKYTERKHSQNGEIQFKTFHNEPISEDGLDLRFYPNISELTGIYAAGIERLSVTEETVKKWILSTDPDDRSRLKCALKYFAKCSPERAYELAKEVANFPEARQFSEIVRIAYKIIVKNKCPESERIAIDYMVEHDNKSIAWDICGSYWDDEDPRS